MAEPSQSDLTIGQLAQAGAVGVETVRYYQRRGLIETPRRGGGIRRYGPETARRLRFIRAAQTAGFSLNEIGELLALDASRDRARAHELAGARIAVLDQKIADLTAARASLKRLARACAGAEDGPCPIIEAFEQG
jgi:Predicted transcriptional regulators